MNRYNEEEYGKAIKENGFLTKYHKYELVILVKYLKIKDKMKKQQIIDYIYNFCRTHMEGFNEVKYFKQIDAAIIKGCKKKNKLVMIDEIPVTYNEIEHLDNLDVEHHHKKLLLAFLVKKKINRKVYEFCTGRVLDTNLFGNTKAKYKEVFNMANLDKELSIDNLIAELVKKGIIEADNRGIIDLKFINEIEKDERIYFNLTDFENVGYLFDYYKVVNGIKRCECCGKLIRQSNNKTKYCRPCAKVIKKENDKRIQKERYISRK